jgi:hypothetical protein
VDWDLDQADCECVPGVWTAEGGTKNCCGDDGLPPDGPEFLIEEFDSTLNDGVNSDSCCMRFDDCVDDDNCYASGSFHDLSEAPATGDLEYCEGPIWRDSDEDVSHCDDGQSPFGIPLLGTCGSTCWVPEGESVDFGGYTAADSGVETDCCGDDLNEYYITTNENSACCDQPDDFVHSTGICANGTTDSDPYVRRNVYGWVIGERIDGSFGPLANARVVLKWLDFNDVNVELTNAAGHYNISVPRNGNFDILVSKTGFVSQSARISGMATINVNFSMPFSSDCQPDCSRWSKARGDFVCDRNCDGVNGCVYDPSVFSTELGAPSKEICHDQSRSWKKDHNATFDIKCCNGGYVSKFSNQAELQMGTEVRDAQTYYAGTINYQKDGQLYGVYVVVYSVD